MYKILYREISTLLFKITVYFVKTKLVMFYSGIMSDTGAFANLRKTTISFVLSNRLSLTAHRNSYSTGRILLKFEIYMYFSRICPEISSSIKITQE